MLQVPLSMIICLRKGLNVAGLRSAITWSRNRDRSYSISVQGVGSEVEIQ
jgi:hypothetical protein